MVERDGTGIVHVLVDAQLAQEPGAKGGESGIGVTPRPVEVDGQVERDAALVQDEHAVSQNQRLVDVVRDKEHGRTVCAP